MNMSLKIPQISKHVRISGEDNIMISVTFVSGNDIVVVYNEGL
jgi:hypothetical protein